MERRKFIKNSLSALPMLFLPPMLLASCKKDCPPNGKTVVVIGAGIAGLAAAKKLKQKGFTVIVLEAQEKAGGRIRTDRSLGLPFDEGASWIHGPRRNPIKALAADAGATTYLTDDDSVVVFDSNGAAYPDSTLTSRESEYEAALNAVKNAGSQSESFQAVFERLYPNRINDRLWKYLLSANFEFDMGGDMANISSLYFDDDEQFSGKDVIITNGYDKITDYLAEGLDIRLNIRVTNIDYSNEKSIVSSNTGDIEADFVLVTVPLGVLKNNAISFSPALSTAKQEAINGTNMGNVNKFLLLWSAAFWDDSLQYIGYSPETKGKFNYFLNLHKFSDAYGLMTFALGDYATATESMSDSEVIDEIMLHLRAIYGSNTPRPDSFLRTRWGQNINSFGAYSHVTNGRSAADFDTLAQSINNRLFFAGEHTNREYRGTAHGAYLSGIREADKINDLV